MFSCYRKDDAFNAEAFVVGVASVLDEYDASVIDEVTDPKRGLPSRSKFPPNIYEVRQACEALVAERAAKAKRSESLRQVFEDRAKYEAEQAEKKSEKRPTRQELIDQGYIKPRAEERNLPAKELWEMHCRNRRMIPNIGLSAEARDILESVGYDIDGPDEQFMQQASHG